MSDLELQILKILQKERLHFEREKTFSDLRGGRYRYDFYVMTDRGNVLIEIDGIFHFKDIHGRATFMK
jgi:very-short-patch-repair endonuclease